eukprot:11878754-Heterocapsa_arctica.AAC.1
MGAKDAIYKVAYLNISHVYIFTYHKIEEFDVDFTTLFSDVLVQGGLQAQGPLRPDQGQALQQRGR